MSDSMKNMATGSTSRGSNASSNGLLTVTITDTTTPRRNEDDDEDDLLVDPDDPFDITQTKNAPPETLKRWRVCMQCNLLYFFLLILLLLFHCSFYNQLIF